MSYYRYSDPMGLNDPWTRNECQWCYHDSTDCDMFWDEPRCSDCAKMEQDAYDDMLVAIKMGNGYYKERDIERNGDFVEMSTDSGKVITLRDGSWTINMKVATLEEVIFLLNSDQE